MSDVELVRLLTSDTERQSPELLAAARAEAERRDVPIDPSFIPAPDDSGPSRSGAYEIAGHAVVCPHCKNAEFTEREVLLNSRGFTFLRLDWLNRSATALVCTRCGLLQFFAPPDSPDEER